jgi:hypothetical protein
VPSKWFLIVRDGACSECGLVASSIAEPQLGQAIVVEARRWVDLLASPAGSRALSTRPSPDVWSALEYGCHVRDTIALFEQRTRLALTANDPTFSYQDQDASVVDGHYNDSDPWVVAGEIVANAGRFEHLLKTFSGVAWRRAGTRRADERFDVALLARFALHEIRHHRVDAEASAAR